MTNCGVKGSGLPFVATWTFCVFGVLIKCEGCWIILHSKATITMYLKFVSDAHPVHADDVINYVLAFIITICL